MDERRRQALKARLGFDRATRFDAQATAERLFVFNYRTSPLDLPGWRLARTRRVSVRPGSRLDSSVWMPGHLPAVVTTTADREGLRLIVDVVEHADASAAQDALIDLAGEFHLPVPLESQTGEIG